jgi:hypothetical protein
VGSYCSAEMPRLEQVYKRLLNDSSWFVKCAVGGRPPVVPPMTFTIFAGLAAGWLFDAVVEESRKTGGCAP